MRCIRTSDYRTYDAHNGNGMRNAKLKPPESLVLSTAKSSQYHGPVFRWLHGRHPDRRRGCRVQREVAAMRGMRLAEAGQAMSSLRSGMMARPHKVKEPEYMPTPEQIKAECEKIRAENGHSPELEGNVRQNVIEDLLASIDDDLDEDDDEEVDDA